MTMKKRFVLLLASLCVVMAMEAQTKTRESKTTFAKEALQPYVESGQLAGAISVFYKDGVQETCCIGYADVAQKRPIEMDNVFMQCSQTKGFCGVTIAKLVEEGKLSLDDAVSKYLPEFNELWVQEYDKDGVRMLRKAKNVLTVRMVLNHTGGFPFEISAKRNDVRGGGWSGGAPLRQVASIAAASPIMFEPGTKELYSNTGIDIGAAIVEVITGMKWEDYLKKEVLDPLGMKSTWFWPTDKQLETKIELYETLKELPVVEEMTYQETPKTRIFVAPYIAQQVYVSQFSNRNDAYDAALVSQVNLYNEYFNGNMGSIVFQEMRESRGLAYGAGAGFNTPSYRKYPFTYGAYISTQTDKLMDAIRAFDEIINDMPQSEAAFALARTGSIDRLRTHRASKSAVLWDYIDNQDMGLSEDLDKVYYNFLQTSTIADVVKFQQEWVKGRTYHFGILGDKKHLDMKSLKQMGEVVELTTEQIFGY